MYSQCNSESYTVNNLQNGKTYVFSVRGTDDVGNQGNAMTYTWKVGEQNFSFNKSCCTFPNNGKIEFSQGITESSSLINFSSMVLKFLPYTYGVLCDVILYLLCQLRLAKKLLHRKPTQEVTTLINKYQMHRRGQDFSKGGSHCVKVRVITRLSCRPPRRVFDF